MYTKGKWTQGKRHTDTIYMADENTRIATCFSPNTEANAQLIVSAVNACVQINPDNPQAVAEGMIELIATCKVSIATLDTINTRRANSNAQLLRDDLAKVGGK